jgi:peroxiredoxin
VAPPTGARPCDPRAARVPVRLLRRANRGRRAISNNLTGDFEAVAQIAARQINGLLATLHANGVNEDEPLQLLHSGAVRVGDRPPGPGDLTGDFGNWVVAFQRARGPVGLGDLGTHLTGNAPPGVARVLADLLSKIGQVQLTPAAPGTVRGTVRTQVASPTLSFPSGSTSEITVHVDVRAHYSPDPDTEPMPEPVHGEVQATFEVRQVDRKLEIRPSSQDSKIQFVPAPGTLSAADAGKVSVQVRKVVRESVSLLPVNLPPGFAFASFKGLGSGASQAIALPIQVSGAAPPPGGIITVNNLFIGPAGFAFAVGREFLAARFQPTLDRLKQFRRDVPIQPLGVPLTTYHVSVTDATLELHNGFFELTIRVKAIPTSTIAPRFENIVVKQRLTLVLFLETLFLPAPDDELTITGLPGFAIDRIRPEIVAERDRALPAAQAALNTELQKARTLFTDSLRFFDRAASASFRAGHSEESGASTSGAIAITPDGIIVRGDIRSTAPRAAPIVSVAETDQRRAFTALDSWIPGGRIDRLIWSWVEYPGPIPVVFQGVEKSLTEAHRFILPKPPGVTELSSICLRIEGTQTLPDGRVMNVTGGTTCHVPDFGQVLEAPSWLEPVMVPNWRPGSSASTVLKDAITGHVSLQADTPRTGELGHNSLVHFADWRADRPLAGLGEALARMRRKGVSLVVIVVLPARAFDSRRRDVEARLDSLADLPVQILLTEDSEGGWTRTFGAAKAPSTYLINARREFVWKYEGAAEAGVLAAALDEHLVPAPAPRSRPLRLAVAPGERAPDVFVTDDRGQRSALHRLRGREVLLTFWQPWSAPCIEELRRLQQLHAGGRGPLVVGFHGGKERRTIDEIRKQHGLSFPLVHDTDQIIARRYGVRCWPTTITLDGNGRVSHVQFGSAPEHAPPYEGKGTGS